ncbi:MAG: isochorismatase family protein [Methylophilaceae bacterium]
MTNSMNTAMANAALSQLVVVDAQIKLAPAMHAEPMSLVIKNIDILAQACQLLQIPVIVTEQYPQGLGETLAEIAKYIQPLRAISKMTFSACKTPKFIQQCVREKPQLILTGMEAHICVLQTALDLVASGKKVFVVEDAIISRQPANKANAIARMREAGCVITNTESVVFEWLGNAEGEAFKVISKLIR